MKNREEQVVFEYLKKLYGENVIPEPEPNSTPDISVNSSTAVEVTRLTQHFFESEKPEGLENLSFDLANAFKEVSESLNYLYAGKSYWVFNYYRRPLSSTINQAKKDMKLTLRKFLDLKVSDFPYEISVNRDITFSFQESNPGNGKLFPVGGSDDADAGGGNISVYAENIRHYIDKKSSIISKHLPKYTEWWLYLVDCIGFWLDTNEISEIVKLVGNTGHFDKVCLMSYDGQNVLVTMSKQKK